LHFAPKISEHQNGQRPVRCSPRRPQQRTIRTAVVGLSDISLLQQTKKLVQQNLLLYRPPGRHNVPGGGAVGLA
jgi:hypothetical protein